MFIKNILNQKIGNIHYYDKKQIIFTENETCENIGIIIEGSVLIKTIFPNGKESIIKSLLTNESFGEHLIFSDNNKYPAFILSNENATKILMIHKKDLEKALFKNEVLMFSFINYLSNYGVQLNNKLKLLSKKTIKEKICYYIYVNTLLQEKDFLKINTLEEMSQNINCDRISFSREFNKLLKEQVFSYNKKTIKIYNKKLLFDYMN